MNSPPEPASPSPSSPSSSSPPPEEANFQPSGSSSHFMNIASQLTSTFASGFGGSSKRRLPGGSSYATGSSRDPKSRRRGEPARGMPTGGTWTEGSLKEAMGSGKREKDELCDHQLADMLKKEIGDPFMELGSGRP